MITNTAIQNLQNITINDLSDNLFENGFEEICNDLYKSEFIGIVNEKAVFEVEFYNFEQKIHLTYTIDPENGNLLKLENMENIH